MVFSRYNFWKFAFIISALDVHFSHDDVNIFSHQMDKSSALLALCEGNPLATGGFPH